MSYVAEVYDRNPNYEWERLNRHRTEFAVTMRALTAHLPPPPVHILDIGGGPGRYALALTQLGYQVTLLDLSAGNLETARAKSTEQGVALAAILQGDATQLPSLPRKTYDAVLLMGPLYHLLAEEARETAVTEALRVLSPYGLLFASFITRFAPIRDLSIRAPEEVLALPDRFQQMLETGVHPALPGGKYPDFYFAHPDEILSFMDKMRLATIKMMGVEGVVAGHEESINALNGELWQAWVEINYNLGQEPSLFGAADHLLYIGQKRG